MYINTLQHYRDNFPGQSRAYVQKQTSFLKADLARQQGGAVEKQARGAKKAGNKAGRALRVSQR